MRHAVFAALVVLLFGLAGAASAQGTPPTPTITPGGPTTFCSGGSVTLTSSSATGNQWYLNGNPIGGATNQTYVATSSGDYTVIVTIAAVSSSPSAITTVTVNPIPATPTITPGGPTTFPAGGSVTLTSSSASGNQWYLDGNPIGGATNQNYVATAAGSYTVTVTNVGCSSASSAAVAVTVTPALTPSVTGTKSASGSFRPGSTVTYTVVLTNSGNGAQADNPGNEFDDVLPASLTLVSATATSGTAVATVGTNTVSWNGAIPPAGSVTIIITATISATNQAGTVISNQGQIHTDLDADGTNETSRVTDEPSTGPAGDATIFLVAQGLSASPIPTLDTWAKLLMAALMLAFAATARRR
jgi:uncharacterized repeat protein (TIGR01451 family)